MQMRDRTPLFVVSGDGLIKMTFKSFNDALKGGMEMKEIEVFTDHEEAKQADHTRKRRLKVDDFSDEEMLEASKMVLMDAEGRVIRGIEFGQFCL